jgi:hypothetical protein
MLVYRCRWANGRVIKSPESYACGDNVIRLVDKNGNRNCMNCDGLTRDYIWSADELI